MSNDNFRPPCQCVICSGWSNTPPCTDAMRSHTEVTIVVYDNGDSCRALVNGKEIGRGWGPEGLDYFRRNYPGAKVVSADSIPQVSNVTQQLIDQLQQRDAHGKAKYGVTLDRTDLNLGDWLQHQAEELMDGAGYALAAKREYERLRRIEEAALAYVEGKTDGAYRQLILALCP